LKSQRLTIGEKGQKVPAYIVTFSDMVTLLLTFFVMLLTLADVQDPELFDKGRDAFIESLRHMGLGLLFGRSEMAQLGDYKIRHSMEAPHELKDRRTIDATAEALRRIFDKLRKLTTVARSPIVSERTNFVITDVHFASGRDDLNEPARKFLTGFCQDLRQEVSQKQVILYVLGLASKGRSEKERWLISARRAERVADFLRHTLSSSSVSDIQRQNGMFEGSSKYSVYSCGAGSGDGWADRHSPFLKHSQILIAVLRRTD